MPALGGVRAVVFDVYGTLIQSGVGDISLVESGQSDHREQAALAAFEQVGLRPLPSSALITEVLQAQIYEHQGRRRAAGTPHPEVDILKVWADVLRQLKLPEVAPHQLKQLSLSFELSVNPVWPMPGMASVLEQLGKAGLCLGIVSNAQWFTPLLFEALGGQPMAAYGIAPRHAIWSYALLEAKPSTRPYEHLAEALQADLGITPAEMLYVGNDMRNDVMPASKLGMRTALFAGDKRSLRLREGDPLVAGVTASAIVTDLNEIPQLICHD